MTRPQTSDVDHGAQSWDATLNIWRAVMFDTPFPAADYADYASLPPAASYDRCLAVTINTSDLWISDGFIWTLVSRQGGTGASFGGLWKAVETAQEEINLAVSPTSANLFPANCIRIGVTARVTQLVVGGGTGWGMEDSGGSFPDLYAAKAPGLAQAQGTLLRVGNWTSDPRAPLAATEGITVTPQSGGFTSGRIRVVFFYQTLSEPSS